MIEQKHKRGLRQENWLNPDGSVTQRNAAGDLFYKNHLKLGDGDDSTLRKVDLTPVPNAEGWTVQFAPYNTQIPLMSDTPVQYVDVRFDGVNNKTMPINIECVGVGSVQGVLSFNKSNYEVRYQNAYGPGAHLVYRVMRHGITKLVVIDPDSAVTGPFVFNLHTNSNWSVERDDGRNKYELSKATAKTLDTSKKTVFKSAAGETYLRPFTWKSGHEESGILPVQIEYLADGVWQITKDIPAQWTRTEPLEMDVDATSTLSTDGRVGHTGAIAYNDCVVGVGTHTPISEGTTLQYNKGSAATRFVYRPYLVFSNTVPASATVTACTVSMYCVTRVALSTTPTSPIGALVDFVPTDYTSIAVGDYVRGTIPPNHMGDTQLASAQTISAASATYTWTITDAATNVAKNTYNGWGIREYATTAQGDCDMRGTTYAGAAGYAEYNTGEAGSNIPVETITYTPAIVPSATDFLLMGVG